jgi:hypothetical protein
MFRSDGPKAWHTKPGHSHLDDQIAAVVERKGSISHEEGDPPHILRKDGTIGTVENEKV